MGSQVRDNSLRRVAALRLTRFAVNAAGAILALAMLVVTASYLRTDNDDSFQYKQAAMSLLATGDPYRSMLDASAATPPNPNPPLLAYLLTPLAALPQPVFQLVWLGLNCLALAGLVFVSLRLVDDPRISAYWGAVAGFVAIFPPVLLCLVVGQLGIMLALLAVLSLLLAERRPAAAGASLAAATAIKLYPGFLGIFFLVHGPRRVVWWAAFAGAVLLAVPVLFHGIRPYTSYLERVLLNDFYPFAADFNVSLTGLFSRLFTVNQVYGAVAPLPGLARWLSLGAGALVVLACLLVPAGPDRFGRLLAFCAWICGMQLVTPLNGFYNLGALLLPILALVAALLRYPSLPGWSALALAVAALFFRSGWAQPDPLLSQTLYNGWGLLGLVPATYACLLLLALCAWFARRHRRALVNLQSK